MQGDKGVWLSGVGVYVDMDFGVIISVCRCVRVLKRVFVCVAI